MKKIVATTLMSVCFSATAHESTSPPQLWSDFKDLNASKEACEIQSLSVLEGLNLSNIIQNQYGIYGIFKSNRIVVKCLKQGSKSKVWVAVAGHDRDTVEMLRNKIIQGI